MNENKTDKLLSAKGKGFYDRLKKREFLALTAMKGEDTMSIVAVSIRGKVREFGYDKIPELFEKNPYMHKISHRGVYAGSDGLSCRCGGKKVTV